MDLISRHEAVRLMEKLYRDDCEEYGCPIPECFDSDRAIDAINSIPSAQQTLVERIEMLEKFNNKDCPEWVKNVIKGII